MMLRKCAEFCSISSEGQGNSGFSALPECLDFPALNNTSKQ